MNPSTNSRMSVEIGPPAPDQVRTALALALGEAPAVVAGSRTEVMLLAAARAEISLDGLLVARRHGELVGAAWCQAMGGRVASVEPPRVVQSESTETLELLATAQADRLRNCGTVLAQVVLPCEGEEVACELLTRHGYSQAAELLYLAYFAERAGADAAAQAESPLRFDPFEERELPRLERLVSETYRGSLDCPLLDGQRDIADVLAGYRQTGEFDPSRWLFVRHEDRDVGCLLLADFPTLDHWELVYMGVVPEQRGRDWGVAIVREAQRRTRAAGRSRLVLAVDAANRPALSVYLRSHFQLWNRRQVWLRFFGQP